MFIYTSLFRDTNSVNTSSTYSDLNDSISQRSLSPFPAWTIKYKTVPKKTASKGIWGGYQTKEEFMMMHLR